MDLRIGDRGIPTDIEERTNFVSRHTGRTCVRLHVLVSVSGKGEHDRMLDLVQNARHNNVSAADEAGRTRMWKVRNHSYSYQNSGDSAVYNHRFELEEDEELMPTSLHIDELVLRPHKYEEEFDREALIISAWTSTNEADSQRLKDLVARRDFYPVVRVGISEEIREMRFGAVLWSEDGASTKHRITLVERIYDEQHDSSPGVGEPEASNVERSLATGLGMIDGLLETLGAKEILTPEEIAGIRLKAEEEIQIFDKRWAFRRVEDADKW